MANWEGIIIGSRQTGRQEPEIQRRKPDYIRWARNQERAEHRVTSLKVVNMSVRPSYMSVRPCQLDRPLIHLTSIRVTRR